MIFFVNSLQIGISGRLIPFVTSDFNQHALLSTTSVVSSLVAGVIKLPVAKLMDIFGRLQGFVLMVVCAVIGKHHPYMVCSRDYSLLTTPFEGLIMMAASHNIETYAAAQTFYWVGYNGVGKYSVRYNHIPCGRPRQQRHFHLSRIVLAN